jgi:hypothetical protein
MKIIKVPQNTPLWHSGRLGKIMGSKLKDLTSAVSISKERIIEEVEKLGIEFKKTTKKEDLLMLLPRDVKDSLTTESIKEADKKVGFYQLIADRFVTEPNTDESPMARGVRLEPEAIEVFMEKTGFEVLTDIGYCLNEEHPNIGYSPDGVIMKGGIITEDVEVKCLSDARHLMAFFEQKIPDEYYEQMIQGFIVNPDLERRYMVFYDPSIMVKDIHWIIMERKDVLQDIEFYKEYQVQLLKEAEELINQLTQF